MTNEMAKMVLGFSPYIASIVRRNGSRCGIVLCDLDVDDIVSAVVEKALATDLRTDGNIKGYLTTLARTTTSDFIKSGHAGTVYFGGTVNVTDARNSESTDDDTHSIGYTATDATVDAERTMMAVEALTELRAACEELAPAVRDVMLAWLDEGADFDAHEYAARVGKNVTTIRKHISVARAELADLL